MTIKFEDFDFDNILVDEKSYKIILFSDISYKTLIGPKPLRIRPNIVDGFIRIYGGSRYLDSHDSLPLEKILTLHNVIILIKSVLNKNQNHHYYNIFLEKCSN